MPKTRPAYPEQFRREALELVRQGRSIPDVAESLGVSQQTLRNWRRQGERDRGERDDGLTSAEREELRRRGEKTVSACSRSATSSSAPRLSSRQCQTDACARRVGSFSCCPAGSVVARSLSCRPLGAAAAAGRDFIGAWSVSRLRHVLPTAAAATSTYRHEEARCSKPSRRRDRRRCAQAQRTRLSPPTRSDANSRARPSRPPREGHLAALAWAAPVAGAPLGAGGLPASDQDAGGRPAARRRARASGCRRS